VSSQASGRVALTADATAHAKPSTYTTLISSLDTDTKGLALSIAGLTGNSNFLIDLAAGEESSEVEFLSNLIWAAPSGAFYGSMLLIPMPFASGVRLSARCSAVNISAGGTPQVYVGASAVQTGAWSVTDSWETIHTIGANTADTGGVEIVPGNAGWGSWSEITASAPADLDGFFLGFGPQEDDAFLARRYALDFGLGGGPTSSFTDLSLGRAVSETYDFHYTRYIPMAISSGETISARMWCSGTVENWDVVMYGVETTAAGGGGGGSEGIIGVVTPNG